MQPTRLSLTLVLSVLVRALPGVSCLRVIPDKRAFLLYDSVSLRCDDQDSAAVWKVKRSTSTSGVRTCLSGWGSAEPGSPCLIRNIYPSDIGTYWCESEDGRRGASVNIIIIGNVTTRPGFSETGRNVTGKNLKKTYNDFMGKRHNRPRLFRRRGNARRSLGAARAVPRACERPLPDLHGAARPHLQRPANRHSKP